MKKKVRILLTAVAVLLCAGAVVFQALTPLRLETVVIRPETASLTFTELGSCDYQERFFVYPVVAGEVLEIRAEEGDAIRKGDVIAVVNASDYQSQIEQLESGIAGYHGQIVNLNLAEQQRRDELSAAVENLSGQIAALEAEMRRNDRSAESLEAQIDIQEAIVFQNSQAASSAKKDLAEARDWGHEDEITAARQVLNAAENTLSQSRLLLEQLKNGDPPADVYEEQRRALEAQIESARARMGKSYSGGMVQYYQAQIESAQAGISQMAEMAGKAEITATADGTISELPVKGQNFTLQQQHAAVIGNGSHVEVYVPVREIDGVKLGDPVELILDQRLGKRTISGAVTEIGREAVIQLSALGVEERKVRVLIRPEEEIRIGYDMDVRFTVLTVENALTVPKTAVFEADGLDFVWVIQDGRLQRRQIGKGLETRDGFVADSGLSGEEFVVRDANSASLAEGKRAASA